MQASHQILTLLLFIISYIVSGTVIAQQQINPFLSGSTIASSSSSPSNGKSKYKTVYACEDSMLHILCDHGARINLIRANYGRFSIQQCNEVGQTDDMSTDCMSPITMRIMRRECQDKQSCLVNATSVIFGDKCPKTRKYLEAHFQCVDTLETVNVRTSTTPSPPPISLQQDTSIGATPIRPPNNNDIRMSSPLPLPPQHQQQQQPPPLQPVMNSEILTYNDAANDLSSSKYGPNRFSLASGGSILATFRHIQTELMANPRCVLWDATKGEWTKNGARVIETNITHTLCAFDQATSYALVMDYLGPQPQTVSPVIINQQQQPSPVPAREQMKILEDLPPGIRDGQEPVPIYQRNTSNNNGQQQQQQQQQSSSGINPSPVGSFFSLFGYLLAFIFVLVALMTIAFVVSSMRSSAGATLKSLGNFTAFSGPKYKSGRRSDGTLHHNKDQLLVINNQNGHQFLYTPTNTTKINSSTSTHILTSSLPGQHQGTLHQIQQQQQQQQLYSGNGTLSNLSGTGGQSNNYYYGLTGLNQLFHQQQQQQQQQHLNQHQLNGQQAGYHHQANKSTISNESANSSPSSSGVESGSASMHQQQHHPQQQQQQQQSNCLVMNNDLNLMNHFGNYGQHQQPQHQNPLAGLSLQNHHTTLTLNAHYNSSVVPMRFSNIQNTNGQMREQHIYECVDDDKNYSARLLLPIEQYSSNTLSNPQSVGQMNMSAAPRSAMTLSRFQQQQPQQLQQNQANKRLHPAIVRDNQPTKTNIICSQMAQVTPQRATEINKFQHDIMAVFNNDSAVPTTGTSSMLSNNNNNNKLSTDC